MENSELSWDEQAGKQVGLRHMLAEASMVFVRLLQPVTLERTSNMTTLEVAMSPELN